MKGSPTQNSCQAKGTLLWDIFGHISKLNITWFKLFLSHTEKKGSLSDVVGNSCNQTLRGSLPASSQSSAMVLTEADPGIILISL